MRIDVLARRWGGPDGGPDGMAVAAARLAFVLAELGHEVRAYTTLRASWSHPRVEWRQRSPLYAPDVFDADLVISTISATWRRLALAAERAGAMGRTVYWHHHGTPPPLMGCLFAAPPAVTVPSDADGRSVVLPPSSWTAEAGGNITGDQILVPGAARAKGGHIALEVAKMCPRLRFYVLRGRAVEVELGPWRGLPNVKIADGHIAPDVFLAKTRAVLLPTRAEVHPLSLVEASARGIPIVASDLPGCLAAAPAGRFLPVAAPAHEWRRALLEVLASPSPRASVEPYEAVVVRAIEQLVALSKLPPRRVQPPARSVPRLPALAPRAAAPERPQWRPKPVAARPRVLVLADIPTHAWARKAKALQDNLGDRFDIDIAYTVGSSNLREVINSQRHDLFHTFEVHQTGNLPDGWPMTTGITAHVWQTWGADAMRAWASRAIAFHANSVLLQREMVALLRREIWYVPNGVDEKLFRRTRPRRDSHLVVGFVGKPNPRKGLPLVREACARAGVELRVVERKPKDNAGADDMCEFYQDLHVLAVSSDMDGTPNPALEAAACGVAVVGNRIGNLPEFIEHGVNGLLTERSAESLAAALSSLKARPLAEVEEMGRRARETIERAWTWKRQAEHYAAMWTAALGIEKRRAA